MSLIKLLVFHLQVLGSLLTSLRTAGVVVGVVMLMVFVQVEMLCLVWVSVQFLGLFSLVKELTCGGVILVLQSSGAVHLGVDNLGVVRHVGRLLDGHHGSVPFELVKDGDLLLLLERMLHLRGLDTVRITKVKGHADDGMVLEGRVREVDRLGNDAADEAADFGRRKLVMLSLMLVVLCPGFVVAGTLLFLTFIGFSLPFLGLWSIMMVGKVLLLILWYGLLVLIPRKRRLVHAVRDRAFLLGPPGIWNSEWVMVPPSAICAEDVAHWPYTPGLLVKWVSFLGSLHWPAGGLDLGVGGVSYVELPILYELWAGERLSLEKAHPRYLRPGRPISVSAVPFGPGTDTWRSCRFIGTMMRSLCFLPGGLRRFVPCSIGAKSLQASSNWLGKCCHGLTSRPRESASELFLDELLGLFRYPPWSGCALLAGTLPLRYCAARFACRTPHLAVAGFWSC